MADKVTFQTHLRNQYDDTDKPPKVSSEKFVKYMEHLSDARAAEIYDIYKSASIKGQIKRDYKVENRLFHSREPELSNRKARDKIRREYEKKGLVSKGDGKVIHHKNHDATDDRPDNIDILDADGHRCYHQPDAPSCNADSDRKQQERDDLHDFWLCTIL